MRLFILLLGCFSTALSATEIKLTQVTQLDRFEPFTAQTFHDDHLWVGRSRKDLGAYYKLELYDSQGNLVVSKDLEHSARHLYPYANNSVIVVGISYKDLLSHFTIATRNGKTVSLQSSKIPLGALADEFVGKPGTHVFTDPGGLDDGTPIGTPLKTLFSLRGGNPNYLDARIRGPHNPVLVNGAIYLIENPVMGVGRQLVRFDLKTQTMEKLITGENFVNLITLDNGKRLALADRVQNRVVVINEHTKREEMVIKVAGEYPKGMAQLGHCLVVGSEYSKKVAFYDLNKQGALVSTWDFSPAGQSLFGIRGIAVDSVSGRVFTRSAYPANPAEPGPEERNSVFMAEEPSRETLTACTQK